MVGGGISLLASSNPDGLEWSILKTSGTEELRVSDYIHEKLAKVQNKFQSLYSNNGRIFTVPAGFNVSKIVLYGFGILVGIA